MLRHATPGMSLPRCFAGWPALDLRRILGGHATAPWVKPNHGEGRAMLSPDCNTCGAPCSEIHSGSSSARPNALVQDSLRKPEESDIRLTKSLFGHQTPGTARCCEPYSRPPSFKSEIGSHPSLHCLRGRAGNPIASEAPGWAEHRKSQQERQWNRAACSCFSSRHRTSSTSENTPQMSSPISTSYWPRCAKSLQAGYLNF